MSHGRIDDIHSSRQSRSNRERRNNAKDVQDFQLLSGRARSRRASRSTSISLPPPFRKQRTRSWVTCTAVGSAPASKPGPSSWLEQRLKRLNLGPTEAYAQATTTTMSNLSLSWCSNGVPICSVHRGTSALASQKAASIQRPSSRCLQIARRASSAPRLGAGICQNFFQLMRLFGNFIAPEATR